MPVSKQKATWLLPLVIYLVTLGGCLLLTHWLSRDLQGRIATHFGPTGKANGWMQASEFKQHFLWLLLGISSLLPIVMGALRFMSPKWVNIPNKDYWTQPENWGRARDFLFSSSLDRHGRSPFLHRTLLPDRPGQPHRLTRTRGTNLVGHRVVSPRRRGMDRLGLCVFQPPARRGHANELDSLGKQVRSHKRHRLAQRKIKRSSRRKLRISPQEAFLREGWRSAAVRRWIGLHDAPTLSQPAELHVSSTDADGAASLPSGNSQGTRWVSP